MPKALTANQLFRRCKFRYAMHTPNRRVLLGRKCLFRPGGEDELHQLIRSYVTLFNWFSHDDALSSLKTAIKAFVAAAERKQVFAEPAGVVWHAVEKDLMRHFKKKR